MDKRQNGNWICDICGKEFTTTLSNLRRHKEYKHNIIENTEYNIKCLELFCEFSCSKLDSLRQHLERTHQIIQEVEELVLNDIEEFKKWKAAEETRCVAVWVKRHGSHKHKNPIIYYYCNRSGKKRLIKANQRKRRIKRQGSCKTGVTCTSAIIVNILRGAIKVKYYKNHYGHDNDGEYIPLPEDIKSVIASQINQGVSPAEIISKIRDSDDIDLERLRSITKTDISNIMREYNLFEPKKEVITPKIMRITQSHQAAVNAKNMSVIKNGNAWKFWSGNDTYWVKASELEENHICKYKCSYCNFCLHSYSCTCLDYVMHSNMCIHMHKVCMYEEEQLHAVQNRIQQNINSISTMSDWNSITDPSTLKQINSHLKSALDLIKCGKANEEISLPPANLVLLPVTPLEVFKREETTNIFQKYRPIVPREEPELKRPILKSSFTEESLKSLRTYRSVKHSPEEIQSGVGKFGEVDEVQKSRPNILRKSASC